MIKNDSIINRFLEPNNLLRATIFGGTLYAGIAGLVPWTTALMISILAKPAADLIYLFASHPGYDGIGVSKNAFTTCFSLTNIFAAGFAYTIFNNMDQFAPYAPQLVMGFAAYKLFRSLGDTLLADNDFEISMLSQRANDPISGIVSNFTIGTIGCIALACRAEYR